MKYVYKSKTKEELESIAANILEKVPLRKDGCVVDIEGIIEDFGITLLPRCGGLHEFVSGYTPKDPHYIVMAAAGASYPPLYRAVAAEEFCHIVLEYDLYKPGKKLPDGAAGHELTYGEHQEIEEEAIFLACALVMPKSDYLSRYLHHEKTIGTTIGDRDKTIRAIVKLIAEEFVTGEVRAGRRGRDLKLITPEEYTSNFTNRIKF